MDRRKVKYLLARFMGARPVAFRLAYLNVRNRRIR